MLQIWGCKMFNRLFKKFKEKRKERKRMGKTEEEVHNAIEYFTAHKIPYTLEGIRQFTGLPVDYIESSNAFQSIKEK